MQMKRWGAFLFTVLLLILCAGHANERACCPQQRRTAPCIELPGKLRLQIYEQSAGETANLEALDAFVDDGVSLKIDQLQGETETKQKVASPQLGSLEKQLTPKLKQPSDWKGAAPDEQVEKAPEGSNAKPKDNESSFRNGEIGWKIALIAIALLVMAEGMYILLRLKPSKKIRRGKMETQTMQVAKTQCLPQENDPDSKANRVVVGKVHAQGARESQQDSFSVAVGTHRAGDVLAVVADGMGGLSDGDRVSQTIVSTIMRAFFSGENVGTSELPVLLTKAKNAVDQLLGPEKIRQSGSTVVMGMIKNGMFHYLSVGDSRIALFRDGELFQLNRSHSYEHQLLLKAINGEKSFAEICTDPQADRLTSYLGMGPLHFVDIPAAPIRVHPGDKFILMSDGIFNALTEQEISAALRRDAEEAADAIDCWIQDKHYRNQDNYTAVILHCCTDIA